MITQLLNSFDYYGDSKYIEIAKGKYKLPETIKEGYNQIKRDYKWKTRIKN